MHTHPSVTLDQLEAVIGNLTGRNRSFAEDLIDKGRRYGLSPNQAKWVGILHGVATGTPEPSREADVGSFDAIYRMFTRARKNLKFPKIHLQIGGDPVVLAVAGERSRNPGIVNITDGGRFGENTWYGRVTEDGKWTRGRASPERLEAVGGLLRRLSENPEATASEYGLLTGHCCFCHRPLTDERSTAVGYGPICAERFGLDANWKAGKAIIADSPKKVVPATVPYRREHQAESEGRATEDLGERAMAATKRMCK